MLLPVVKLKTPRNSRHPWIYKKMVQPPRGVRLEAGTLVEVRDKDGSFAGRAFYHPDNTIALRILTENRNDDIDGDFLRRRFAYAKELRDTLRLSETSDSWRLAHAEADALPGLVVDKFADLLLVEPYVSGWLHLMDLVVDALGDLFPGCSVAVRADARAAEKEGVSFAGLEKRYPAPAFRDMVENGVRYRVDFKTGHKTGFFLDQRDNRALAARLAAGRDVLDLCSYTGGFALSAWKGGARSVVAVDLDEEALAAARVNLGLNGAEGGVTLIHRDIFDEMRDRAAAGKSHDLVVLDPPKLAGGQDDVEKALRTYYDMNRAALRLVGPGGLFVTCSCSGAVAEERWRQAVRKAAADAGKGMTIFHAAGPGPDHPVASDFPQGRYLKAMFARVD